MGARWCAGRRTYTTIDGEVLQALPAHGRARFPCHLWGDDLEDEELLTADEALRRDRHIKQTHGLLVIRRFHDLVEALVYHG